MKEGGRGTEVILRSRHPNSFPGLSVFLRKHRPSIGGYQLRRLVFAYPNKQGDIAELDMLVPHLGPATLPCAREVAACLGQIERGEHKGPLRLDGLPPSRPVDVTVDGPPDGSSVFVRLAEHEPAAFSYDLLGDGSELVEYTYDGRMLGLRLEAPSEGSGILVRKSVIPRYREVRAELGRLGFRLNDSRPYLEELDLDAGASSRVRGRTYRRTGRGVAEVQTDIVLSGGPTGFHDLHGDGRVLEVRTPSGRLVGINFYEVAAGVDLSGIPERKDIELIFGHNGVQVTG